MKGDVDFTFLQTFGKCSSVRVFANVNKGTLETLAVDVVGIWT